MSHELHSTSCCSFDIALNSCVWYCLATPHTIRLTRAKFLHCVLPRWEERQLTVMDFQATLEELRTIANSRCVGPGKQSKKLCPCSPTECLTGSFCSIVCYPCAALVLHVNVRTAQKAWWGTETVRARYQTTPDVWVLAVAACLLCDNNFGFLARDASDTAPQTVPKRGHNQSKSLIMNLKF